MSDNYFFSEWCFQCHMQRNIITEWKKTRPLCTERVIIRNVYVYVLPCSVGSTCFDNLDLKQGSAILLPKVIAPPEK